MYNIGDRIKINGITYEIWLIEDGLYHMLDDTGRGICCDGEYLIINVEQ
jgi:hypothetical protein